MAYVATLQKTWVSGAASLVPTWVDPATAITLVADFDSANASESTSTIDNATTSTPTVNVNFRSLGDGWRHALFAVENAAGKSPVFKLNRSQRRNTTAVPDAAWRPAYTLDFETWVHAESFSLTASTIEFEFADPLPSGRVYVASNPILQESWSATFASWLLTSRSSVASPATSSNASGVFHTSPTETDDLGRSVGGRSMYGIKLRFGGATNDGQPKRKLVMFAGVHAAGEADSNLAFKYFTEYLIDSTDTEAVALRANWDVDLYFNLTPNGYFGGHPRTNFRSSADPNRSWDVPYDELSATQTAVLAEIDGGRFDACLSWHGWASATTNFRGYLTPLDNNPATRSPAVTEMLSAGATIFGGSGTFTTSGTNNTDIWWGQSQGAALSVNPEVPNFGDVTLANYQSIGENWAKTLQAVDAEGVFATTITASGAVQAQTIEAAVVAPAYSLTPAPMAQAQTIEGPTLTQDHEVVPNAVVNEAVMAAVAIAQAHDVVPEPATQLVSVAETALSQAHLLLPQALVQATGLDTVVLLQAHLLQPADLENLQPLGQPTLVAASTLVVQALAALTGLEEAQLVQQHVITPLGAYHTVGISAVDIAQLGEVLPDPVAQAVSLGTSTIQAEYALALAGLVQQTELDAITLALIHGLAAHPVLQGQTTEEATPTQAHVAAVQGLVQSMTVDELAVAAAYGITPAMLVQSEFLEAVTLASMSPGVTIAAVTQSQDVTEPPLAQQHFLIVGGLAQPIAIDPVLFQGLVRGSLAAKIVVYAILGGQIDSEPALAARSIRTIH